MKAKITIKKEEFNYYKNGLFLIHADSVADLNEIAERNGGASVVVVTIKPGGDIWNVGALTVAPEKWQSVCEGEKDPADEWASCKETVCTETDQKHELCVALPADEWEVCEGGAIKSYICDECGSAHDSRKDAEDCCAD